MKINTIQNCNYQINTNNRKNFNTNFKAQFIHHTYPLANLCKYENLTKETVTLADWFKNKLDKNLKFELLLNFEVDADHYREFVLVSKQIAQYSLRNADTLKKVELWEHNYGDVESKQNLSGNKVRTVLETIYDAYPNKDASVLFEDEVKNIKTHWDLYQVLIGKEPGKHPDGCTPNLDWYKVAVHYVHTNKEKDVLNKFVNGEISKDEACRQLPWEIFSRYLTRSERESRYWSH